MLLVYALDPDLNARGLQPKSSSASAKASMIIMLEASSCLWSDIIRARAEASSIIRSGLKLMLRARSILVMLGAMSSLMLGAFTSSLMLGAAAVG